MSIFGRLALMVLAGVWSTQVVAADASSGAVVAGDEGRGNPRCLSLIRIKSTRVLDGQTILFDMNGGEDYINRLPRSCPGLGFYKSFAHRTGINQVCDLDVITVLESGRRGATCGLGKFEPYVAPVDEKSMFEDTPTKPDDSQSSTVKAAEAAIPSTQ